MSLRSLGLEHPWLLTHPVFWTAQHLDLVDCRFQSPDGHGTDGLSSTGIETGPRDASHHDQASVQLAEIFAKSLALRHKTCALVNLLECNGSPLEKAKDPPAFVFAKRPIDSSDCTVFHITNHSTGKQHQDALPIIGYLDYQTIISKRRQKLTPRPHPRKGYNGPVQRLYRRKLSKITPRTWCQDPYLACILLSMAQSLARKSYLTQPGVYVTRLLVTIKSDPAFVHLFEAEISPKLLDILDDPAMNMKHISWPIIRHSKLAFQPYCSLQGRLIARLVGAQESLHMGTTNFNGAKIVSKKRKLAEENDFARRVRLKG